MDDKQDENHQSDNQNSFESSDVNITNQEGLPSHFGDTSDTIDDEVNKTLQSLTPDQESHGHRLKVKITRPAFTQEIFDQGQQPYPRPTKSIKERFKEIKTKCACSSDCCKKIIFDFFPFIDSIRTYNVKEDLLADFIAGMTIGIMHIPQGMAYGLLTNLPPVYGLYVSFFPVIFYFFLGTSRHISMGTFAVVSLMVGSVVDKADCSQSDDISGMTTVPPTESVSTSLLTADGLMLVVNTTAPTTVSEEEILCKLGVATAVTFIAGLMQFGMGLFRLGFVTIYLSEPLTRGFTTGAACHVFTSQIKHVFGIPVQRYSGPLKLIYSYIDFFSKIAMTNIAALIISVLCLAIMFPVKIYINPRVKKYIKMPLPIELIIVVFGTLVSYLLSFNERFGVRVVGKIPTGLPPPSFPPPSRFSLVVSDAVGIAIVAFAINVSMSQLFAKKHGYEVRSNQELMAYGITNSVSSMFNCFASAASLSRSLVQDAVGGKTQLASLVSCVLLIVVLYGVGPLFEQLPSCVLAAIIIVNLKGMFLQLKDLKELWHISKYDFMIWLVVFAGVVIVDVDLGLMMGVGFCLLTVVFRTQSPHTCLLGRVPKTDIYKDLVVYPSAGEIPGLKVFRFEASLYYANAEHFVQKLFVKTGVNPRKLSAAREKIIKNREKREKKTEQKLRKRKCNGNHLHNDAEGQLEELNVQLHENRESDWLSLPEPSVADIVIDCTTMGYIDYVGVSTLSQVIKEYDSIGVNISLAGCKAGVREMLEDAGFYEKIPKNRLFVSIHDAVLVALEKNPSLLEQLKCDSKAVLNLSSFMMLHSPPVTACSSIFSAFPPTQEEQQENAL